MRGASNISEFQNELNIIRLEFKTEINILNAKINNLITDIKNLDRRHVILSNNNVKIENIIIGMEEIIKLWRND